MKFLIPYSLGANVGFPLSPYSPECLGAIDAVHDKFVNQSGGHHLVCLLLLEQLNEICAGRIFQRQVISKENLEYPLRNRNAKYSNDDIEDCH